MLTETVTMTPSSLLLRLATGNAARNVVIYRARGNTLQPGGKAALEDAARLFAIGATDPPKERESSFSIAQHMDVLATAADAFPSTTLAEVQTKLGTLASQLTALAAGEPLSEESLDCLELDLTHVRDAIAEARADVTDECKRAI